MCTYNSMSDVCFQLKQPHACQRIGRSHVAFAGALTLLGLALPAVASVIDILHQLPTWIARVDFVTGVVDKDSQTCQLNALSQTVKESFSALSLFKTRHGQVQRVLESGACYPTVVWNIEAASPGACDHLWLTTDFVVEMVANVSKLQLGVEARLNEWVLAVWKFLFDECSASASAIIRCYKHEDGSDIPDDQVSSDAQLEPIIKGEVALRLTHTNKIATGFIAANPCLQGVLEPSQLQIAETTLWPSVKLALAIQAAFAGVLKEGDANEDAASYCSRAYAMIKNMKGIKMPHGLLARLERVGEVGKPA